MQHSTNKYNVLICLGSDWSPTESKNLLWELKVADLINKFELNKIFSPRQFVEMVTINPAQAIGLENKLGRITQG